MTEVGESGIEVALGESDMFTVLMAKMNSKESNRELHDEKEGRNDDEIELDVSFRGRSLMEEERDDDNSDMESEREEAQNINLEKSHSSHSSIASAEDKDPFHPDLMKSLITEGQEAMWMEDEVSTVTSVYVNRTTMKRFSFRPSKKEVQPEKIHVRKKKITKTVVLLPQKDNENEQTLVDANAQEEAAANIVKARVLLNEALHAEGESVAMAKIAFEHAATARRLMSKPEDEPDLENILTVLKEKGEDAVARSRKSKGVISGYARKALHYLESILPSTTEKDILHSVSNAEDSVSTLGLQTDTFEYQMGRNPSQAPSQLTSYHNMDLMSISSLNEILDGPTSEEGVEKTLSPRQMLPEIHIPSNKTPKSGPSLSADVQPSGTMDSAPDTLAPSLHGTKENKQNKKWVILMPFRRGGRGGKSHLPEVTEDPTLPASDEPTMPSMDDNVDGNVEEMTVQKCDAIEEITAQKLDDVEEVPVQKHDFVEDVTVKEIDSVTVPEAVDETISVHGRIVPTLSNASESKSKDSKRSRYHIIVEQKPSHDGTSVASSVSTSSESIGSSDASEVALSRSAESVYRMDTVRSDWDQSINFRRNPTATAVEPAETNNDDEEEEDSEAMPVVLGTSRSANIIPKSTAPEPSDLRQTRTDCDTLGEAERIRMHQKSIANLSGEESSHSTSKAESNVIQTPSSKWGTSVGTHSTRATKDIRSTLGNAGVETISESDVVSQPKSEAPSVQSSRASRSCASKSSEPQKTYSSVEEPEPRKTYSSVEEHQLRSDPDGSKEDSTVAPTIAPRRKISHVSSRERDTESVFDPPITALFRASDESTRGDKDSLIDFVISPRRANIVTPGGTKPFVTPFRGDESSKILTRTLPAISEKACNGESNEKEDEHLRPLKRFPVIFGNRKGKVLQHTKSHIPVKPHFDNLSQVRRSRGADEEEVQRHSDYCLDRKDETSTMILEKVVAEGVNKAEEANLEVMTAPFPHKRYRHRKIPAETRRVPSDLVEAIRMQSGREHKRIIARIPKKSIGDAPGISFSIDPDIDSTEDLSVIRLDPVDESVADIRVLAPTPRNRPSVDEQQPDKMSEAGTGDSTIPEGKDDQQVKYDQRKVSERLYGPIEGKDSFIGNHTKVELNKGVYIGDLLGSLGEQDASPANTDTADVDNSEDVVENKENEIAVASPKASAASKRARRSLFGLRRNVLSTEH